MTDLSNSGNHLSREEAALVALAQAHRMMAYLLVKLGGSVDLDMDQLPDAGSFSIVLGANPDKPEHKTLALAFVHEFEGKPGH